MAPRGGLLGAARLAEIVQKRPEIYGISGFSLASILPKIPPCKRAWQVNAEKVTPGLVVRARNDLSIPRGLDDDSLDGSDAER